MSENKINWRDHEVGAIWNKQNGALSLKITIEGKVYNLVAMVNKFKDTDAKPSYRIYNLPPQSSQPTNPQEAPKQASKAKTVTVATPSQPTASDTSSEELL